MTEAEKHPYYKAHLKMKNIEKETFSAPYQTLIALICWDLKLVWFKLKTRKQARDFIDRFGDGALPL